MTLVGEASFDVTGKTENFEHNVTSQVKKVAATAAALFAGSFVVDKGLDFLRGSVEEGREANKVAAQTEAVIKSTGGVAHITGKQIDDLANSISRKTGIDDEAIASSEDLLLTFTNVRNEAGKGNDVFNQATSIIQDMSKALGQDGKAGAIQLGKALNDPIAGVTALRRVGVSFTEQQQAQIKDMVEHNNLLGAQKIVLGELSKEFGGSAAAQATGADKARVAMGNFKEEIGTKLIPMLDKLAVFGASILPPAMALIEQAFTAIGDAVRPIIEQVAPQLEAFFNTLRTGFTEDEGTPIENFALFLRNDLLPVLITVGEFVQDHFKPILLGLALAISPVGVIVAGVAYLFITHFQQIKAVVGPVIEFIVAEVGDMVAFIQTNLPAIEEAFSHIFNAIRDVVTPIVLGLAFVWHSVGDDILHVVEAVFGLVFDIINRVVRQIRDVINVVLALINGDWGKAWAGLKDIVVNTLGLVGDIIRHALDAVKGVLGGAGSLLKDVGKDIIDGLIEGIKGAAHLVIDTIKKLVIDPLPGFVKKALGISSPSKVFMELGQNVSFGFAEGIKAGAPAITAAMGAAIPTAANIGSTGTFAPVVKIEAVFHGPADPATVTGALRDVARGELADVLTKLYDSTVANGG